MVPRSKQEWRVIAGTHHTPAVASYKVNAVIQDCTARATAALQNGGLEDVPLVTFWVVAFHKHHVKMRETCMRVLREENLCQVCWFIVWFTARDIKLQCYFYTCSTNVKLSSSKHCHVHIGHLL